MPRKLKVFRTSTGFHDAYVAAPSQKAALEAWGADSNIFAQGIAEQVTDPTLMEGPLASPGKVIKRVRASADEHFAELDRAAPKKKAKDSGKVVEADRGHEDLQLLLALRLLCHGHSTRIARMVSMEAAGRIPRTARRASPTQLVLLAVPVTFEPSRGSLLTQVSDFPSADTVVAVSFTTLPSRVKVSLSTPPS